MENSKHKTNKLNQKISSLQPQSNPNDNKLTLHQQKINENHLIYEKLERKYTEINQIYINKIVEEEGHETHGEPQQNGQILSKGVLKSLLPPTNKEISEIDVEGICRLLGKCGKLLEEEDKKCCDESINILANYAQSFGGAVRDLVDDLHELRNNNWLKSALQEKYSALRQKHKKLQMKYDKLHGKYVAMMKRSDYICWKAKDIVNWIMSLNKWKYRKYCQILREKMENEGIDGKCLPDVDKDDLRRLGVTDFKDNCEIYDAINQLINKANITTVSKGN